MSWFDKLFGEDNDSNDDLIHRKKHRRQSSQDHDSLLPENDDIYTRPKGHFRFPIDISNDEEQQKSEEHTYDNDFEQYERDTYHSETPPEQTSDSNHKRQRRRRHYRNEYDNGEHTTFAEPRSAKKEQRQSTRRTQRSQHTMSGYTSAINGSQQYRATQSASKHTMKSEASAKSKPNYHKESFKASEVPSAIFGTKPPRKLENGRIPPKPSDDNDQISNRSHDRNKSQTSSHYDELEANIIQSSNTDTPEVSEHANNRTQQNETPNYSNTDNTININNIYASQIVEEIRRERERKALQKKRFKQALQAKRQEQGYDQQDTIQNAIDKMYAQQAQRYLGESSLDEDQQLEESDYNDSDEQSSLRSTSADAIAHDAVDQMSESNQADDHQSYQYEEVNLEALDSSTSSARSADETSSHEDEIVTSDETPISTNAYGNSVEVSDEARLPDHRDELIHHDSLNVDATNTDDISAHEQLNENDHQETYDDHLDNVSDYTETESADTINDDKHENTSLDSVEQDTTDMNTSNDEADSKAASTEDNATYEDEIDKYIDNETEFAKKPQRQSIDKQEEHGQVETEDAATLDINVDENPDSKNESLNDTVETSDEQGEETKSITQDTLNFEEDKLATNDDDKSAEEISSQPENETDATPQNDSSEQGYFTEDDNVVNDEEVSDESTQSEETTNQSRESASLAKENSPETSIEEKVDEAVASDNEHTTSDHLETSPSEPASENDIITESAQLTQDSVQDEVKSEAAPTQQNPSSVKKASDHGTKRPFNVVMTPSDKKKLIDKRRQRQNKVNVPELKPETPYKKVSETSVNHDDHKTLDEKSSHKMTHAQTSAVHPTTVEDDQDGESHIDNTQPNEDELETVLDETDAKSHNKTELDVIHDSGDNADNNQVQDITETSEQEHLTETSNTQQGQRQITASEANESAKSISQQQSETGSSIQNQPTQSQDKPAIRKGPNIKLPNIDLLEAPETIATDESWIEEKTQELNEALYNFNVPAEVQNVTEGPSVTRFELSVEKGVKVSKITALQDDIKMALAARDIRIEAPIPGTSLVGIEVPNQNPTKVNLRSVIESSQFKHAESKLTVAMGYRINNEPLVMDIAKTPHALIAGATGSGKSVSINSILMSLLYKNHPEELRLLLIDPKMVELAPYNGLPHLVSPVITDVKAATQSLKWAVEEMDRRYKLFAQYHVRNITAFNKKAAYEDRMPKIVIVIDELADLMMMAPQDVEQSIARIAQKARACGIHMLVATQRPSVNVITGLIKANIPTRIAFMVSSSVDSRTILDSGGAERLLGNGDMLYLGSGMNKPIRVQGTFVSDDEIDDVVDFIKQQREPDYLFEESELLKKTQTQAQDELFDDVCQFMVQEGHISTSLIQRHFQIGYNRAARMIDQLEQLGYISGANGSKPRDVYITESDLNKE